MVVYEGACRPDLVWAWRGSNSMITVATTAVFSVAGPVEAVGEILKFLHVSTAWNLKDERLR